MNKLDMDVVRSMKFNINVSESIDFMLEHCKDARWDILTKSMNVLEASYTNKCERDKRSSETGVFTRKLIALMKQVMRKGAQPD